MQKTNGVSHVGLNGNAQRLRNFSDTILMFVFSGKELTSDRGVATLWQISIFKISLLSLSRLLQFIASIVRISYMLA